MAVKLRHIGLGNFAARYRAPGAAMVQGRMIMLGADKITTVLGLGVFALGLVAISTGQTQAQSNLLTLPGEGFGSGVYIDGREPVDRATRDKVDAYLEGYRRRQDSRKEYFDRLKSHQNRDLISRSRSVGRY